MSNWLLDLLPLPLTLYRHLCTSYFLAALKHTYETFGLQVDSQSKLNMPKFRRGRGRLMNVVYMFILNHTSNCFTRKQNDAKGLLRTISRALNFFGFLKTTDQ